MYRQHFSQKGLLSARSPVSLPRQTVGATIMNFTVRAGIGILLVLTIIGLLLLLSRNSFKSENSKRICIVTGALQAVHIILYLTGLLEKIAQINVYIAFFRLVLLNAI